MLNNDLSCALKKQVTKLVNTVKKKSSVLNIQMTFTTKRFPSLRVNLNPEIERLTIDQDFCENICDKITAELTLHRDEYVTLYYFRKDLECTLILSDTRPDQYCESGSCCKKKTKLPHWEFHFRASIIKYENIFDKISVDRIGPQYNKKRDDNDRDRALYKMTVELIDEKVYKSRKAVLNDTAKNVKMIDIIRWVCNVFGFSSAMIIPPDNKWTYTNFIIPPSYGVESIMSFLQNAAGLGIYMDGLTSFITRWWKKPDTLSWFICPRYGSPLCKNPIHVYVTGNDMYTGLNQNHYHEGCTTHILVTDTIDLKNWSDIGSENAITGINYQCSPTLLDGSRFLKADDDVKAKMVASFAATTPSDPLDMQNFIRSEYHKDEGNIFRLKSMLRPPQHTTIQFKWAHAEPWTFTPGTKVTLHYDHPLGYRKFEGQVERAVYNIMLDRQQHIDCKHICTGLITMSCGNVVMDEVKPGIKAKES